MFTKEQEQKFQEWADERYHSMFEIDKFRSIGKEYDYFFRIIVHMAEASQKMSLAFTLTDSINDFPAELTKEFRDIATQYHELQDKVRKLRDVRETINDIAGDELDGR